MLQGSIIQIRRSGSLFDFVKFPNNTCTTNPKLYTLSHDYLYCHVNELFIYIMHVLDRIH